MPKVMPAVTLLKVLVVFGVALAFGIAHLSLRFQLNKIELETGRLQSLQGTLASEVKALEGRTAALKNTKWLTEYGCQELGMVPYRQDGEKVVVRMRQDVHERYELARASLAGKAESAPAPYSRTLWIEKLGDRVGLIGDALAGEKDGKKAAE
jgi:hypothetical protein